METPEQLELLSQNEKQSVELFKAFIADTLKFREKGTASAAARARKSASALAKLLKPIRKELQDAKAALALEKKIQKGTPAA